MKQFLSFFIIVFLGSCQGFLEENDRSLITTDEFFLEEQDAQFAVNSIYSHLGPESFYAKYYWQIGALASDIGKTNSLNTDLQELATFTWNSSNGIVETIWSELYAAIQTCNFAINNIPDAPNREEEKDLLIAEARFFRALFHFDLVRYFGDVPLELAFYNSEEQIIPTARTAKDSVLKYIAAEFTAVSEILPNSHDGRPNNIAAMAYLVKTYVLLKNYPMAYLTSQKVLSSLSLQTDYADVFKIDQNLNNEIIFAITFNNQIKGPMNIEALPNEFNGLANCLPTANLLTAFDLRDRRLTSTLSEIGSSIYVTKFWDQPAEPNGGYTANDLPLLRLPDIMLTHIEIINEVRRSTNNEAVQLMNVLRTRARFDGVADQNILPNVTSLNYEKSLELLLLERKRELAFEGYRWFDLVRLGQLEESVIKAKPDIKVETKHYLFPIPQSQIDRDPLLTQNPGY